jgi:hypothetical protein
LVSVGTACHVGAEDEKERNRRVGGGRRLWDDLARMESIVDFELGRPRVVPARKAALFVGPIGSTLLGAPRIRVSQLLTCDQEYVSVSLDLTLDLDRSIQILFTW